MSKTFHPVVLTLTSLTMLLAACSSESSQQPAENGQTQQAPPNAPSDSERIMGYVRWDALDLKIRQVECRLLEGAWSAEGRGNGFRFSAALHGQWDRNMDDLDFDQIRSVAFRIDQEENGNLNFSIGTTHNLAGDIEGSTEGFSGRTRLMPVNAAASQKYPYPEGIDVEFEINCPAAD